MTAQRVLGVSLLLLTATACVPQGTRAPKPLKPEDGPAGSVRVGYTGGLLNRSLNVYFRTEQAAYVVVAHLGGDGVIRVLYPESPLDRGYVRAKKTVQTPPVAAQYDGIPSLFSYTMSPHRNLTSLYDSYDGRGHGYVFMVATRTPMRTDVLDDFGDWSEWEVDDYERLFDPRYAVRDFAETLASGRKYTLKFASSFGTMHYDSYASRAWDCALLSNIGFFTYSPWLNSWNSSLLGLRSSPSNYCGEYAGRYAYARGDGYYGQLFPNPTMTPAPDVPGGPAPTEKRPGRRGLGPQSGETTRALSLAGVAQSTRRAPLGGDRFGTRRSPTATRPRYGEARGSPTFAPGTSRPARPSADRSSTSSRGTSRPARPSAERSPSVGSSGSRGTGASSTGSAAPRAAGTPRSSGSPAATARETKTGKPDSH